MMEQSITRTEVQLGIEFVDIPSDVFAQTRRDVTTMADTLQVATPHLVPARVLPGELSEDQAGIMDDVLSKQYAREAVNLQATMADVPIEESGERMVSLPAVFDKTTLPISFSDEPYADVCGTYAGKPRMYYVRESVVPVVLKIATALASVGVKMHVVDGFRPPEVTRGIRIRRIRDRILSKHPHWSIEEVLNEADSKTANRPRIAGHSAGSAIDFFLSTHGGELLDTGNDYSGGGASVALKWPYVTAGQWRARALFTHATRLAGGYVYPYEDWHVCYGDGLSGVTWEGVTTPNFVARYGPIRGFDLETGEIYPYPEAEYDVPFVSLMEVQSMIAQSQQDTI